MTGSDRYDRQTRLPEIGAAGQARLRAAHVLVVGAGGLGSALLPLLAGAGIGRMTVIDHDSVALSNLHRQTLFRMDDIGRPKAVAAAQALHALNPDCRVRAVVARIDPARAVADVAGADLVIDAADSFAVTYTLSDICQAAGIGLISASVLGRAGYVGGFCGGAPSYRAVFPDLPPVLGSCASAGVMGPAVAMLGAMQAQMALSVLIGLTPPALGQMLNVDLAAWHVSGFRFDGAPEPADLPFPPLIAATQIGKADRLIDLRASSEAPLFPGAARLSEAQALSLPACPGRTVLICASGLRAWRTAQAMRKAGADAPLAVLAAG